MSTDAGGGLLRRLATDVRVLTEVPPAAGTEHPLGLGLPRDHRLNFTDARSVSLPTDGTGFTQLSQTVSQPIYGLADSVRDDAWRALLTVPTAGYLLRETDTASWALRDIDIPGHLRLEQLRHVVLLGAVAEGRTVISSGGLLSNEPVVGVVELLIAAGAVPGDESSHAWAAAKWCTSADATIEAIAALHPEFDQAHRLVTGTPSRRRGGVPQAPRLAKPTSMMVLLPKQVDDELSEQRIAQIQASAMVAGFAATVMIVDSRSSRRTRMLGERISEMPSSVLIVADAAAGDAIDLVTAYQQSSAYGRVFPLTYGDAGEGLLSRFRAQLSSLAGVSGNHLPLSENRPTALGGSSPNPTRNMPDFPIRRVAQTKNHSQWGSFHQDADSLDWFARDRAGHGERHDSGGPTGQFKRFRESATGLECVGSINSAGQPLDKHESSIGMFVPWSELNS